MIWWLIAVYGLITFLNFWTNFYRMLHTKILKNKYTQNINCNMYEKNLELIIPVRKVLNKAHIFYDGIEYDVKSHYISYRLDNALIEAFYHYKYLMKHCLTWVTRIPIPKFRFIRNKNLNLFVRFFVFVISTIVVYLFGLYLDSSGLGLKVLNYLSAFVNNLFCIHQANLLLANCI